MHDMSMVQSEKKWLVRSLDSIAGPYTLSEIEELLYSGEISPSDEVAGPCTFWSPFLGHPEFKDFIQKISLQGRVSGMITKVTEKISSFTDKTIRKDQTQGESDTQTLTDSAQVKDAVFKTVEPDVVKKAKPVRYYSKDYSQKVATEKTNTLMSTLWRLIVLFVIVTVSYILYTGVISPLKTKRTNLEEIRGKGLKFYMAGDYDQAFSYFKLGIDKEILDFEEKVIAISLYIQKDQIGSAERILDSLSDEERGDSRIKSLKGLVSFYQNNWSLAEKHFLESKSVDPESSLINLGILNFSRKDYLSSLKNMEDARSQGYKRGILFYLEALNLVKLNRKDALVKIENFIQETSEYHQEMYFLIGYLYLKERNEQMARVFLQKSLNEDPFFISEYKYSSFIAKNSLNWDHLFDYCNSIYSIDEDNFLYNLIYGFCYLKNGVNYRSVDHLEKAKKQAPQNSLVLSIYAYYLMKNESFSEAETILEAAVNNNSQNYYTPYVLKAYAHEKKQNWSAALREWENLLEIDDLHLSALAGIAFNSAKLKRKNEATQMVDKTLSIYPYYIKVLLLKD